MTTNKNLVPSLNTSKRILVVNSGSAEKRFVFQKLKQLNIKVVLVHDQKNWALKYIDDFVQADVFNENELFSQLDKYIKKNKIDGIYSFREDNVTVVSKIADRYGFIGIPHKISSKVRNKYLFREFCSENNIPVPKHKLIRKQSDLENINNEFNYPVVLKPAMGASNAYVMRCNDYDELISVYHYIQNNMSSSVESAILGNKDILAEEYIDGDEVDVDMIIQNGKTKFAAVTDNFDKSYGKFFLDSGQITPSTLDKKKQQELIDITEEILEKLGIINGCIHFECKSTPNGPVPIEMNLRMGGDYIYTSIKKAYDVNLIEQSIKVAFGEYITPIKEPVAKKHVLGWDVHPEDSGILTEFNIDPEIKKLKHFEEMSFSKKVGDAVLIPPEGVDIMGWIVVSGENLLDAQDNLKEALENIDYKVSKFDSNSLLGQSQLKEGLSIATFSKQRLLQIAKFKKLNLSNLEIGIACNQFDGNDGLVESDLSDIGKNIKKALETRGHRVTFYDFNNPVRAINQIKKDSPDIVFNVCERIHGSAMLEPHAAAMLDVASVPYTGSNPATLGLCLDKIKSKKLLTYHEIPTPAWDYAISVNDEIDEELEYPMIVKPANMHNSIGIDNNSVVRNEEELRSRLKYVIEELKSVALIEEFIQGDEYNVPIIGNGDRLKTLPMSRTIFKYPEGTWAMHNFDSKWKPDSISYTQMEVQRPPSGLSKNLLALIAEIALDAYNLFDCHDYARAEIKVDENNNPYLIEINPNPSINKGDTILKSAELIGMEYVDFLEEIIVNCIDRYKDKPTFSHLLGSTKY